MLRVLLTHLVKPLAVMLMYVWIYVCMFACRYICNNFVVDGGWSSWIQGTCSKTCGGGTEISTRRCNNPVPSCGGNDCRGLRVDTNLCNTHCCPGKVITKICMHIVSGYHHNF